MWKKVLFLTLASTSLFAAGEDQYNLGMEFLKEARADSQKIVDWKLKDKSFNCIDTAIIILQSGPVAHAGQVANAAFFDICNSLTHVPDVATYSMMEKITIAEIRFRNHLMTQIKCDMENRKDRKYD